MSKKFIKKNLFMIIFMAMAMLAVVALLVMVYFEHQSMKEYDTKKIKLLEKIQTIIKQTYTPTKINISRIKSDIAGYTRETKKIQRKFGHPYAKSIKSFVETLGINLNEFKAKFGEFWESKKGHTTRDLIFHTYKVQQFNKDFPKHRSEWDKAMLVFMREAQKERLEEITSTNVDEIFLAIMGKGRSFSDPTSCLNFMKRMRFTMIDYFAKEQEKSKEKGKRENIGVNCADTNFSFDISKEPLEGDMELIAKNWEIVADLGKRIANSKVDPGKDVLELVSFSKRGLDGEKDGDYIMYRFSFTVNADLNTIRRIVKKLYDAYKEDRVYAVRSIKITRMMDGVKKILDDSERVKDELEYDSGERNNTRTPARGSSVAGRDFGAPTRGGTEAVPARSSRTRIKEKKTILTPKNRGYAKVIVGRNNICVAEFEVDYIIFDNTLK